MAVFRSVHLSYWTDTKVVDNFTPEDKYFMLYCLTNEYTNICGCYEISIKQMCNDLGYNKDTVERLLERFRTIHKMIDYDYNTKELFVRNWYKYNWTSSNKIEQAIISSINGVKSEKFKNELIDIYNSRENLTIPYTYGNDRVSIPYVYGSDTTDTDTVSININIIIDYLNKKLNSNYRSNNKMTIRHIKARLQEGYSVDDFKKVIDKMYNEWYNTEMQKYLRPETLFGTKFEGYLNMQSKENKKELPQWFDKNFSKDKSNLDELGDILKDFE